jgi:hypothetical protein
MADQNEQQLHTRIHELEAQLRAKAEQHAAAIQHLQAQLAEQAALIAQLRVRWVQRAVEGALAETRLHHRSVLAGRCTP